MKKDTDYNKETDNYIDDKGRIVGRRNICEKQVFYWISSPKPFSKQEKHIAEQFEFDFVKKEEKEN